MNAHIPPQKPSSVTGIVSWSSKFEIGIPVIDAQHKKLVTLCNNLYKIITSMPASGPGSEAWHQSFFYALHECVDYTKTHFHDEEVLMTAAKYGGLPQHKARHTEFVKQVLETAKSMEQPEKSAALQFVRFLYDWILSHIALEDKQFAAPVLEYFKSQNAENELAVKN